MMDTVKGWVNWNDMRFDTALSKFEDYLRYEEGEANVTCHDYVLNVKQLLRFTDFKHINKLRVTSINKTHVRDFLRYYMENYSPKTRNKKYFALKKFFNWLDENKKIRKNPIEGLKCVPVQKNTTPIYLTKDEIDKFLETVENLDTMFPFRDRAIVYLLLFCGLRREEVVKLNLNSINLEEETVKVLGKGNKERIVPLHKKVKEVLNNYLNKRRNGEYFIKKNHKRALFISVQGSRLTKRGIKYVLDKYVKKSDINKKITPHKLRHSFASLFYSKTKDLKALQELLGHASIGTTEIYTHTDQEHIKKQINSLDI